MSRFAPPPPHPSGATVPALDRDAIPRHLALVMDGNGRWANDRGLPRTEGHREGERALMEVVAGAIDLGIPYVSAYAFSTENWKRSPAEVAFLMNFTGDVMSRQLPTFKEWGIKVRWAGRRPRLWKSVINRLETAERETQDNDVITLTMCVNYGGRAEIADAAVAMARDVQEGRLMPGSITEDMVQRYLDEPQLPDVDLFLRSSGEQRLSNFMLWQSAYAEMMFLDVLWPDMDRRVLWRAVEDYAHRNRRYGGAMDQTAPATGE